MIVDDDQLTCEVLGLLASEAGFETIAVESGQLALDSLAKPGARIPNAVLADMQMPGVSGDRLARLLRSACGPATTLFAMSGTAVAAGQTLDYDGFLLKPFSAVDLAAALADPSTPSPAPTPAYSHSADLNPAIYAGLAQSMPREQVRKLYIMCLDDAEARIQLLRKAAAAGDGDAYRRAAHSIKGGCGMVGATELARLAAQMEESGPETVDNVDPYSEFLAASARLRRILDAH